MKKFFFPFHRFLPFLLFLVFSEKLCSQSYYNEWIDYNKTYYKFKVGVTGLYRISQSTLQINGLGNVPAEQFQLWRNGVEVPLFTSTASGVLPENGYIEFWGEQNDGKPDKNLYKNAAYQLSDVYSLQTDTAAYFLTINASGNNLRYTPTLNDVANNSLPAEPFFIDTCRKDFKNLLNRGRAVNYGEYVYSSTYDMGEFWSSYETNPTGSITYTANNLFVAMNGPDAQLDVAVAGNSVLGSGRRIVVTLNNSTLINQPLGTFDAQIFSAPVSLSLISSNTANFKIVDNNSNTNDRIVAAFIHLSYPRMFNFGGATSFVFYLPPALQGNYLEISNFNGGAAIPVLYDITNGRRYEAVKAGSLLKFALLPSSVKRKLVLVNEEPARIFSVTNLVQRNFINFSATAQQGNYLIISNKLLFGGVNQVEEYRKYRASTAGGGYNSKIYEIEELTDQFAYGIKKHPLAIKNFLRYAHNQFQIKPEFVFLIGKAVTYDEYRKNESSRYIEALNLVPTFGWPASDNLLSSDNLNPTTDLPIGRLAAINSDEVKIYLDKIKLYEQQQMNTVQTIENKAWMKTMVHVTGANSPNLDASLSTHLRNYERVIEDTLFGANVTSFNKTSTGPVTPITNALMEQLFSSGISLLNYFGHSSATALDYNLNDPYTYSNYGKYPVFIVNGCNAGNFYAFDTSRFSVISSLAERFILAKEHGAIGFIASTHFGVETYLDTYNSAFYAGLSNKNYNRSVFYSMQDGAKTLVRPPFYGTTDSIIRYLHAEQTVLHGDPALKINAHTKPDFVIEEPQVVINPSFVSVADTSFQIKVYFFNIGKATGQTVSVLIKRQYPSGETDTLFSQKIPSVRYEDSLTLRIPIIASRDKGENKLIVSIDNAREYDELSEMNNEVTKSFFIYENELRQVYPYNLSIMPGAQNKLIASTANPTAPVQQYKLEIDTTALYNSSFKISKTISSKGGLIEFESGINFQDSMVYYWRVAPVPDNNIYHWNSSSFLFLNNSSEGWNQSHLYQHLLSSTDRMYIDSTSRLWNFKNRESLLQMINSVYPLSGTSDGDFQVQVNGTTVAASACVGHSVIFNIFDPVTLKPLYNQSSPSTTGSGTYGGFMGSGFTCNHVGTQFNFEFSYMDSTGRRKIRDFMDWIPNGYIVTARLNLDAPYDAVLVDDWKMDEQTYGAGNSAYQRFKDAGFSKIDSFTYPRTWVVIYQKNTASFIPTQQLSAGLYDRIIVSRIIASPDTAGFIISPSFGPAKAWKNIVWKGKTIDASAGDKAQLQIVGIRSNGQPQLLYTIPSTQNNFDISSVSASEYPYIQLKLDDRDSIHFTPYQLQYWRVLYEPVPEGALAPNLLFNLKDSLELGEQLQAAIAFKNVSTVAFADSIRVKAIWYNKNNEAIVIPVASLKKLLPGDTAVIRFSFNTQGFEGANTLYIDVNPDNQQPEQSHNNNFMYRNIFVKSDAYNPLLDVTFDGVHILNNDIVAAKPHITIKLKDESKYLLLDDTSLISVQLVYPDNSIRRFYFNTDTLHFQPAVPGGANEALIDFTPYLSTDGAYQLYVKGKDKSGNAAGNAEYRVSFQVINKPMISNMFNYPNPFTTSTAFVFTITGSEVPQNIRIQILTITGKIVKEITKEELGPLHIGRNITEYKWDGRDEYGQKLANGVYLYRFITNLNGKSLDKFQVSDANGNRVDTDKYFNKGYGKMYLMR